MLISEAGDEVNFGTIIGVGDKPLECTFDTEKLLREEATRLEVYTPGGELAFLAKLPEEPRVPDHDSPTLGSSPLDGILPRANSDRPIKTAETCGPENKEGSSLKEKPPPDKPPPDKQEKPKADDSGCGTPDKVSPPKGGRREAIPRRRVPWARAGRRRTR